MTNDELAHWHDRAEAAEALNVRLVAALRRLCVLNAPSAFTAQPVFIEARNEARALLADIEAQA